MNKKEFNKLSLEQRKDHLNELVLNRRLQDLAILLQTYNQEAHSYTEKAFVLESCRRVGFYKLGLKFSMPKTWDMRTINDNQMEADLYIWCLRFLNLLGASHFALKAAKLIEPKSWWHHQVVANIYLSNHKYEESAKSFQKSLDTFEDRFDRRAAFLKIGLSDALAGSMQISQSIKILKDILPMDFDHYFKAITHQALSERYAIQEDYESAWEELKLAETYFPQGDIGPDFGIFLKWKAYVAFKLKIDGFKELFKDAEAILHTPERRPELWLHLWELKNKCQLLDGFEQTLLEIHPTKQNSYPVKSQIYRFHYPKELMTEKINDFQETPYFISLTRGEFSWANQKRCKLPQEIKCLAALVMTGQYGIPLETLKCFIYPDELGSYEQLENRLFQIFKRLKVEYQIIITTRENHAYIDLDFLKQHSLYIEIGQEQNQFSFFESHKVFKRQDFENYYSLNKSKSTEILSKLVEEKKIIREQTGNQSVYKINEINE